MARFTAERAAAIFGEALGVPFKIAGSTDDLPRRHRPIGAGIEQVTPQCGDGWVNPQSLTCNITRADLPDLGVIERPFDLIPVEIGDPFLAASAERANVELMFWLLGVTEVAEEHQAIWASAITALQRL